jgi:predicted branched-subunit amino acid permease
MATSSTRVPSAARRGVLTLLPLLVAYMPFALVVGSAAADHGAPLAGWAGSWLIFGGSAHLAAIQTLDEAGMLAAILTGLLINARLLVYSTSLASRWTDQPPWFRFAAAGLIIDPTWAVADQHADRCADSAERRRYFLAAGLTLGTAWSGAIAVGAVLGARLDSLDLQIAVPLCLLGLVGATLRTPGGRAVSAAAGVTALVSIGWPSGTGILAAVVAGSVTGLALEGRGSP